MFEPAKLALGVLSLLLACVVVAPCRADTSITQYGITWTFDRDYPTGTFVNGDYWVVGPVKIIHISNTLNTSEFPVKPGQNGSMVNPVPGGKQGYDSAHAASYVEALNAALPGGKPLSESNPLLLSPEQNLVSAVSWLYKNEKEREKGCPEWYLTKTPRGVLRTAAILTCLAQQPPVGSFRPGYCDAKKGVRYSVSMLKNELLPKLKPVAGAQGPDVLAEKFSRPWIDHVPDWDGAIFHPSENMPGYGREIAGNIMNAALTLTLDPKQLPGGKDHQTLLIHFVQLGLDLASIADAGGEWRPDGGHCVGRKLPILFAGVLLDDPHLKEAGNWKTMFQEDAQTFYVTQAEVDLTASDKWSPDKRRKAIPYTAADIGVPEWGIRHATKPTADNNNWETMYRPVNNAVLPGLVLAARIMHLKELWKHDALFDYVDRVMKTDGGGASGTNALTPFGKAMWAAYRASY